VNEGILVTERSQAGDPPSASLSGIHFGFIMSLRATLRFFL
jgi:hypothetical protein